MAVVLRTRAGTMYEGSRSRTQAPSTRVASSDKGASPRITTQAPTCAEGPLPTTAHAACATPGCCIRHASMAGNSTR